MIDATCLCYVWIVLQCPDKSRKGWQIKHDHGYVGSPDNSVGVAKPASVVHFQRAQQVLFGNDPEDSFQLTYNW